MSLILAAAFARRPRTGNHLLPLADSASVAVAVALAVAVAVAVSLALALALALADQTKRYRASELASAGGL